MATIPHILPLPTEYHVGLALARLGNTNGSFCLDASNRFTFLGVNPVAIFTSHDGLVTFTHGGTSHTQIDHPVSALQRFASKLQGLPIDPYLPFYGGLVGYVGFEWGAQARQIQCIDHTTGIPDAWFGLYDTVVVFDHIENTSYIASIGLNAALETSIDLARARAEELLYLIAEPSTTTVRESETDLSPDDLTPVSPRRHYRKIAKDLQQSLWQGTAQKINFAQRYVGLLREEPWALHARLRESNPAPFSMFLNPGTFQLCSASPTCFLSLQGNDLIAKPVLATTNHNLELLSTSTEITGLLHRLREELAPLADGKVSESPPHIKRDKQSQHLSCDLRLRLRSSLSILDALACLVPGLSMTGFPKDGALQLLTQHEPFPRHAYTGAMGFWAPQAQAQFNLCVRLLTIHEGLGYLHAASWLDAQSDIEQALDQTDTRVAQFFSRLHNMQINSIHEQSLY